MSGVIEGFDYVAGIALSIPKKEWEKKLAAAITDGGYRRVEKGETFAHDARGRMMFEVYAPVAAKCTCGVDERVTTYPRVHGARCAWALS